MAWLSSSSTNQRELSPTLHRFRTWYKSCNRVPMTAKSTAPESIDFPAISNLAHQNLVEWQQLINIYLERRRWIKGISSYRMKACGAYHPLFLRLSSSMKRATVAPEGSSGCGVDDVRPGWPGASRRVTGPDHWAHDLNAVLLARPGPPYRGEIPFQYSQGVVHACV